MSIEQKYAAVKATVKRSALATVFGGNPMVIKPGLRAIRRLAFASARALFRAK